jgi:hypothetical protein
VVSGLKKIDVLTKRTRLARFKFLSNRR